MGGGYVMRLNPKQVRFVAPFVTLGADRGGYRFVGRENNVQLVETALVVEGNLLKVSLLGLEVLFRRALSEWTAVTVPYSRISRARQRNWPLLRLLALLVAVLSAAVAAAWLVLDSRDVTVWILLYVVLAVLAAYCVVRIPGRYEIVFRDKPGRRRVVRFVIRSKKARQDFHRRLVEYRAAAQGAGGGT